MNDRTHDDHALAPLDERTDDLELVTRFLNGQLDPDRLKQVRRRLDDDPEFRDLAAPMLLTWSVPRLHERHPRPPGELERHWDDFTRRAGFAHQRRKARRRNLRLLALAFLVLGLAGWTLSAPLRAWYVERRDFAVVPLGDGWIPLGDSIEVQFVPSASVRSARESANGTRRVLLDGTARFRVLALDSLTPDPRRSGVMVHTAGGVVTAGESEFTVTTRGDTTDVEVHRPSRRRFLYFVPLPTEVAVRRDSADSPMILRELDRARLVRGRIPERLNTQP